MMAGQRWHKVFTQEYDPLQAGSIDGTDTEPHDRAIIRALDATYKPNKSVVGDPSCTLFVSRLNYITTEKILEKEFSAYGKIRRMRLVRDIVTGMSKGYAFIEYEEISCARKAWHGMNRITLDDKMILVEFELERTLKNWVPRRLGGGIGGKKESGQLRFGGREKPFHEPIVVGRMTAFSSRIGANPSRDRDSPDSRTYKSEHRSRAVDIKEHSSRYHRDSDSDRSRRHRADRSRSRDKGRRNKHTRSRRSRSRSADRSEKRKRNDRSPSEERSRTRKGRY